VNGFGFSALDTLLVQMPGGAFQLVGLAALSIVTTRVKNTRVFMMIVMLAISLIGMIMVYTINQKHRYSRLAGIWLAAVFAADIPISLSLITSNVGGFTKRATVSAMLFVGYCVGNIIGPQFFYASEAPKYPVKIETSTLPTITNNCLDRHQGAYGWLCVRNILSVFSLPVLFI
jgi:hypothetical protein